MDDSTADPITLVVHELRSPLALIATAASLISDECPDINPRQLGRVIEQSAARLLRTSQALLEVQGVLASGKEAEPYHPESVLRAITSDGALLGRSIDFRAHPTAIGSVALGMPEVFEALVQTLLNNAIDHGADGAEVCVWAGRSGEELQIDVENQVDPAKRHRGFGLGNVIAERLAVVSGAELSRSVEGDRYRVRLRLGLVPHAPEGHSPHHEPLPAHEHRLPVAVASV